MRPMLATAADPDRGLPRDGARWAYEVKWDGMRVLVEKRAGTVTLWSRTERDVTVAFPELAGLGGVPHDLLLDGEIVVLADGVPSFATLADRFHVTDARRAAQLAARSPVTLVAFDLLRLDGDDLTGRPWHERRAVLGGLTGELTGAWQLSPVHDDVEALLAATVEHNLEGVVAKRRSSRYLPNTRSRDWIKLAHKHDQVAVIGGWRPETNDRFRIGALLIGIPEGEGDERRLRFAGRVGSGLVAAGPQADLQRLLEPLTIERSPFDDAVPRIDARGATWVQPSVVVEVRHLGRTDAGRLRQPVFRGLRTDVEPQDVRDE